MSWASGLSLLLLAKIAVEKEAELEGTVVPEIIYVEEVLKDIESQDMAEIAGMVDEATKVTKEEIIDAIPIVIGTIYDILRLYGDVAKTLAAYIPMMGLFLLPTIIQHWGTIWEVGKSLYQSVKGFLDAIHFQTMMKVHNIAYTLSADYRNFVNRIYKQISLYSEAIGLGPHTVTLLLRDARDIVLDTSNMLGRSYDLSEISWLGTFNDTMQKIADRTDVYRDNPERIFTDIDLWVTRPHADLRAGTMSNVLTFVGRSVEEIDKIVTGVDRVRDDIGSLIHHLPDDIRKYVEPMLEPIFEKYDEFIEVDYRPAMTKIDEIIEVLSEEKDQIRGDMGDLLDRLKKPGDYISEIDAFPDDERIPQEVIVGDIAGRVAREEIEAFDEVDADLIIELHKRRSILEKEYPPPEWFVGEVVTPHRPADVDVEPRKTWFVGDY